MNITEESLHRKATEVAIWAQPLMNFEAMYDALNKAVGLEYNGDIAYHSTMQDWKRALPTPNDTTPYVFFFWDLADGPVVVDIPPTADNGLALYGTLMDSWHRPIEEYGVRGADGGRGGKYLMVPPGYTGYIPHEGYQVFYQKSNKGFTLMRPLVSDLSEKSIQQATDLVKQVHVYPYSQTEKPTPSRHLDVAGKDVNGIVQFDADLYKKMHTILADEFLEDIDLAMMGMLEAMGITKGQEYKTTPRCDEILTHAAKSAHEYMVTTYHYPGMIPPFYEGKQWGSLLPPTFGSHHFDFEYASHLDYDRRGSLYYAIFSSIKHYGPGSFYLDVAQDKNGNWFDGRKTNKMTVPADVPAKRFWALTAYNLKTAAFIRDMPKAGVSSIEKGMKVNDDGTVDLYMGPKAPKGMENNWVPTKAGEQFYILFRFYGAENTVFTKEWQLNDVEIVD